MTLSFTTQADPGKLAAILEFVERACRECAVAPADVFAFRLAAEEICTNLIKYGYEGMEPGPITLDVKREGDQLVMTVSDRGNPFDPAAAPPPDLTSDWETRKVGGLGVHLVGTLMDDVQYEAGAGGNRLTVIRKMTP